MRSSAANHRLAIALTASLFAHAALLWWVRPGFAPTPPAPTGIRVKLRPAPAPAAPAAPVAAPSTAQAASADPSPRTPSPLAQPPPRPAIDWRQQAREVARDRALPQLSPYVRRSPPTSGVRTGSATTRIPGLETTFRSPLRPRKICGRMVRFELGVHRIEMPVTYACEEKDDEYRDAPAQRIEPGN